MLITFLCDVKSSPTFFSKIGNPVEEYVSEPDVDTSVEGAKKRTLKWEILKKFDEGEAAASAHTTAVKFIMDDGEFSFNFSNESKKD